MDLAEAHVKALAFLEGHKKGCLEAVNIGTGKGTSVLEIISCFEEVSKCKLNWSFGPKREGDVVEIFANCDKASNLLGWKSKLSINDAVIDAWKWELFLSEK